MTKAACMMTDTLVSLDDIESSKAIVVKQEGRIIGVVSTAALDGVKTVRVTFTRTEPSGEFTPVQGQAIEAFGDFSDGHVPYDEG